MNDTESMRIDILQHGHILIFSTPPSMNSRLFLGACVAFFTATLPVCADLNPDDLSGRYRGQGENYTADVTIRKNGERYSIEWKLDSALYAGIGIREGNVFSASFGAADQAGVAVYRIEREQLVGRFTAPNMSGLSTETLTPAGPLAAEAAPRREPGDPLAAGTRVAARWNGDSYYLATVKSREGDNYRILYDDGTPSDAKPADLIPLARPEELAVGRRVLGSWSSNRLYPGSIVEIKDALSVMVKWDDGSATSSVPKNKIAIVPAGNKFDVLAGVHFQIGARVAARWATTSFYAATIQSKADGKYHVLYDDGDQADVPTADLLPIASPYAIVPGIRVLACWMGGARMYSGVVTEDRGGGRVLVKWDDGDTPSTVPKEKIALLPAGLALEPPAPEADPIVPRAVGLPPPFEIGSRVAARWATTTFYLATVKSRDAAGKYHVVYDDNDQSDVTDADMLLVAPPEKLVAGARVLACWASARMYPGTVVGGRDDGSFTVKWDDGSAPSPVAKDKIAILPPGFQ